MEWPMGSGRRSSGFTLLQLIVVISIIGILATIVMPALTDMPRRAAEAPLKTDRRTMRDALDQQLGDKGQYPKSLEGLVTAGYLRKIPVDPITKSAEAWVEIYEEIDTEAPPAETELGDENEPGVEDVRSGSSRLSLDGTPYSEW